MTAIFSSRVQRWTLGILFAAALPIQDFLAFVRQSLLPRQGALPLPA